MVSSARLKERLAEISPEACKNACYCLCDPKDIPKNIQANLSSCSMKNPKACEKIDPDFSKMYSTFKEQTFCYLKGGEFCRHFIVQEFKGDIPFEKLKTAPATSFRAINAAIVGCASGDKKICDWIDQRVHAQLDRVIAACQKANEDMAPCNYLASYFGMYLSRAEFDQTWQKLRSQYCAGPNKDIVKSCKKKDQSANARRACSHGLISLSGAICDVDPYKNPNKRTYPPENEEESLILAKINLSALYNMIRTHEVEFQKRTVDFKELSYDPPCDKPFRIEAIACEPNRKGVYSTEQICRGKGQPNPLNPAEEKVFQNIRKEIKANCQMPGSWLLLAVEFNKAGTAYEAWTMDNRKSLLKIKAGSL